MTPAKQGPINQHVILHNHYGINDCCLCRKEAELTASAQRCRELERALYIFADENNWEIGRGAYGPRYLWKPIALAFDRPWRNAQLALKAQRGENNASS